MTKELAQYIATYIKEEIYRKQDQIPYLEEVLTPDVILEAIKAFESGAR